MTVDDVTRDDSDLNLRPTTLHNFQQPACILRIKKICFLLDKRAAVILMSKVAVSSVIVLSKHNVPFKYADGLVNAEEPDSNLFLRHLLSKSVAGTVSEIFIGFHSIAR